MPLKAPVFVQAPALKPSRFGLLSVAERPQDPDPHWTGGVEFWPNPTPHASLDVTECDADPVDRDVPEGRPTADGYPIRYWSGFTCKIVGLTLDEASQRATTQLLAAESATLEQAVWAEADEDSERPAILDADTAILGQGTLLEGVAALEDWLYTHYSGTGVLHLPRSLAPRAGSEKLVERSASSIVTRVLETPVSFGAYPAVGVGAVAAPAGKVWIAATGAVQVRTSAVRTYTGNPAAWFDAVANQAQVIAERTAVVTWDKVSAAVLVDADTVTEIEEP